MSHFSNFINRDTHEPATPRRIRLHEDGSCTLPIGKLAPQVARDFTTGALRSGLAERLCQHCGGVWLSRTMSPLCPVCDPTHVGYEPDPPAEFFASRKRYWQDELLALLRRRARSLRAQEYVDACERAYTRPSRLIVSTEFLIALRRSGLDLDVDGVLHPLTGVGSGVGSGEEP